MSNIYIDYLKYCLNHKKNVFKICWKNGERRHAITHDLSKFLPSEFFAYARYFYGKDGIKFENACCATKDLDLRSDKARRHLNCKEKFDDAWLLHYYRNKHHWKHWCFDFEKCHHIKAFELVEPKEMPIKYMRQMIYDWEAMGVTHGDTAQTYYLNNYKKIRLNKTSRFILENELWLIKMFPNQVNSEWEFYTIEEIIKSTDYNKKVCDSVFSLINKKYGLSVYDIVAPQLLKEKR